MTCCDIYLAKDIIVSFKIPTFFSYMEISKFHARRVPINVNNNHSFITLIKHNSALSTSFIF